MGETGHCEKEEELWVSYVIVEENGELRMRENCGKIENCEGERKLVRKDKVF